jgi:NAD(P)H dehydrogenase (quinone)
VTTSLIVLVHPDAQSFNAQWAEESRKACTALGHDVLFSDLAAMKFDAIEKREHYDFLAENEKFDVLKTQEEAANRDALPHDVADEIQKLRAADNVIFHFPLWWFAPPALLKGWFERVLAHEATHNVKNRFDNGQFKGKRALFCVTTGSSAHESAFNGKEGDANMLLWPAAYTLRYLGFSVLKHEIIHGVHGYHRDQRKIDLEQRLKEKLAQHKELLAALPARPELQFNADGDFDKQGKLSPNAPSYSPFIRHKPDW